MSTFKGIISEFPQIRIDYFRHDSSQLPPLACFLTHVHSDHLAGLESLRSPFVYCSAATAKVLLRLEKYPHRVNFSRGILESRIQTYKHLKNILKPIPLDSPTIIELKPGYEICVTLVEANHCIGAVMFLIEGQGQAILYTGDIRSETWWVSKISRHPVLAPYTLGVKPLRRMYLDTTFATKSNPYRRFPSKAEGLGELLMKLKDYPPATNFYMEAWTFGYEDVWIALAHHLSTQIHLDRWRWGIYKALSNTESSDPSAHVAEAAALCGYRLGNHHVQGCLTPDPTVRIHSCERSEPCDAVRGRTDLVRIVPIISRQSNGTEIHELGLGGGKGDLDQIHELEGLEAMHLPQLLQMCATHIKNAKEYQLVEVFLTDLFKNKKVLSTIRLDGAAFSTDSMMINQLIAQLLKEAKRKAAHDGLGETMKTTRPLARIITFPYSRHSSYEELRDLVAAFKPGDIWPCTVDEDRWTPEVSMKALFGDLCSNTMFEHDDRMMALYLSRQHTQVDDGMMRGSQATNVSEDSSVKATQYHTPASYGSGDNKEILHRVAKPQSLMSTTCTTQSTPVQVEAKKLKRTSSPEAYKPRKYRLRDWAFYAAGGVHPDCPSWHEFGGLVCVRGRENPSDLELGDPT